MRPAPAAAALALAAACSSGSGTTTLSSPSASLSTSPSPGPVVTTAPASAWARPSLTLSPSPSLSPRPRRTASAKPAATRSPSPKPSPTPAPAPTRSGKTYAISEVPVDTFSPTTLALRRGDSVLVTNKDSAHHTFTIASLGKDSGDMAAGDTYRLTFNSTGTFHFVCSYHDALGMNGNITVRA